VAYAPILSGRTCSTCEAELAASDRFCPRCGAPAEQPLPQPTASFQAPMPRSASRSGVSGERFSPGQIVVERFRIVTALGRGGMGEVFRADDLALGQSVALKFLPASLAQDADRLQRLRGEVKTARQVAHPNVCRVYDLGEAKGQLFISMEFIDGQNLGALLQQISRLPEERGVEIARQLCLGLGAIHDRGLLHRDLKPGNVMLDGRGQVRITDFGLAAPMEQVPAAEVRDGTPAYQSPEQLAGREVTTRSDIYALGLILYELFTGKKPFTATERAELARSHAEDPPSRPSSHVSGFNPAIEQIILKCLEKEPRERPRTAYEVLAALPGGDPLQAALAAGQTPSPEMVANAKTEGSLHPLAGLALLVATLAVMALVITLNPRVRLFERVPQQLSPRDLAARARELIKQFGYTDPPRDSAWGLEDHPQMLKVLRERDKTANRWAPLATGQPPAMYFWYRQSPERLHAVVRETPHLAAHRGQVSADDPPFARPGMLRMCLDMKGRLIEFQAVPLEGESAAAAPSLNWPQLLQDAGLKEMQATKESLPGWIPPLFVDTRLAWRGVYAESSDIPVCAEAGVRSGRLVFFHAAPEHELTSQMQLHTLSGRVATMPASFATVIAVLDIVVWTIGAAVAWHNIRQGRGNVRGAALLAGSFFAASALGWLTSAHHVPWYWDEYEMLTADLGEGLFASLFVFVLYLAMEPFVRRRWPWRVVAWNRLLAGRWRDPLVGRDVLVGAAAGALVALSVQLTVLLPASLGRPPDDPVSIYHPVLTAGPVYALATIYAGAIVPTLGGFFMFFVYFLVTRREWLAAVAYALTWLIPACLLPAENRDALVLFNVVFCALLIFLYLRFGLLSVAVMSIADDIVTTAPVTFDFSAWYGGASIVYLGVLVGLAVYGFVVASGGQALAWVGHVTGETGAKAEAVMD
jgi:eukaryotic-like serine/threonine-protein kinase